MMRYAFCSRCKIDIPVKTKAITRSELEDEQGLYINLVCPKCATKKKFHVNKINAKIAPKQLLIVLGISIIFGVLLTILFYVMGFYTSFTFGIPFIIIGIYYSSQNTSIQNFNSIRVSRK